MRAGKIARCLQMIWADSCAKCQSGRTNEKSVESDFCRNHRGLTIRYHWHTVGCGASGSQRIAWSVAIYTLRGDCGSLRAALRIIGGRVYSGDGSYQAYGNVGAGGAIRVTSSEAASRRWLRLSVAELGCWALAYCWGRMFRHVVSVTVCGLLEQRPELVS
jgi:hypothetical protein